MTDITKTGPVGLKGLKGIGQQQQAELSDYSKAIRSMSGRKIAQVFVPDAEVPVGMQLAAAGYGDSSYDTAIQNVSQLEDIQDIRAQEQPWYAQLGAGIGKGVALAATTFLDGTVGLITGIVEGIGAKISGDSWEDSVAKLWHNEVSDGLADLNKNLEEWLPNYRTYEELENPWYKNLGTMNFWADNVIKNIGFTVGAFYSGGAWNKALKAIGAVKGAMGAKVVGSFTSALNEGRIEANQNSRDFLELQYKQIDDALNEQLSYLDESGLSNDEINAQKALLRDRADELKEDAKKRANAMGLTTLIGNTVLLSLDNFDTFGKLYARGYKNARTISKGRVTREAMSEGLEKAGRDIAQEEAGKRITKEAGKYIYDPVSKKRAFARGLRHGLVEGNEELAQAFIAETAGNMQSLDSPDAYYEALQDPTAEIKTKDFIRSVTEGFVNTYGNGDRWEEFAVGAFTGLLGIPTFGKVQNSAVDTWLGRGRTLGISGGLFGEFGKANKENMEGQEAVDFMNNYAQKVQEQKGHFVRSQSFTDAMDGWAEADDAFEYKNAEDNSDFAAISRFAKVGRINDLRDMVNQDFENIPDEELAKIAEFTSPVDGLGGWRNTDGSLMSDTEEGRAQMREELIKKRDKILSEIDKYEESVETVRAIGNNSLTEDQVNELAWLNWKVGMFTDRYNSIKAENEEVLADIQNSIQAFLRGRGRGMIDEESDEGKNIIKAMENTEEFINVLRSVKTPLQLGALIEANPRLTDFLGDWAYPILEGITGIDAATFEKAMTDLRDTTRIAKATRTFNQRYKEFRDNPIELIKNRQKIDKKKEKVNRAAEEVNLKDKVNNSNVSDIVNGIENGDLDEGQLDDLFSDEDGEFLNNAGAEGQSQPSGKQKVEEAKRIIKTAQRMEGAIDNLGDSSIDPQALEDARTLLRNSKSVSESEQEMLDTASQAYNDTTILYDEGDPSMQNISSEELESVLSDRIDAAKSVIEQAKAILEEQDGELDDLPDLPKGAPLKLRMGKEKVQPETDKEDKTTGHDGTVKTQTENEKQKERKAKKAQEEQAEKEQAKINDFFDGLKDEVPQNQVATFNRAVSDLLKGIDMLIEAKTTPKQIGSIIKSTQSYQTAKQLAPSLDDYLDVYVTSKLKPKAKGTEGKQGTQAPSQEAKVPTPTVTEEEVRRTTTAQMNSDPNQEELTGTYQYWKPTVSYLPFGKAYQKGNTIPFYKLARTLTNSNGTPMYTEAQLRRIEAVGKYLDEHGAFKLVDSGAVKVGDDVHFFIDSSLNDAAGEIVILMIDSQDRVIGDVMSPIDPRFARQLGLPQFVDRVTKEYQDAGSPQHFTSKETTIVDKNMVGKVPYLADHQTMNTLNEIHSDGERPIPFKIGVAATSGQHVRILATAGRTKRQGQSALEKSIHPPLSAKAGQPFLLMPTSSAVNHYIPVPFVMESYNPNTQNTALGRAIHKVLERIPTSDNAHVMGIINDLEELLSVQEIHINYNGDNVKVSIKPNGAEHQMTIYNGTKSTPNIVEQLELGLQGQPFQISRKYMNEDYYGQDYNRMIGEIARVNLPIGATHTISDWFTTKPISADGKPMKAKSPRSTGRNPYAAEVPEIVVQRGNMQLFVNPKTWTVSDGKKTYTGSNANKVKAQAFGVHMNKNMEQPYDTEWGYYDPKTDNFVEKPSKRLKTLGAQSITTSTIMVPTVSGGTREETVEEVPYSQLKAGDLVWWSGPATTNPVNYINVEGIDNGDVYGQSNGGPIILPKGRTYYRVLSKPQQNAPQQLTDPAQLEDKAKKAGLLGNKVRKALWQALSPEQQSIIANKKGPKQKYWMDALEAAFNPATNTFDEAKLKGTVDEFLGRKALYSRTDEYQEPYKLWDKGRELQWLQKALPNLSTSDHLTLVDGLIRINDSSNPGFAYGKFQEGIITISDIAARGTAYHEAFHAVVHTLLKESEYQRLFDAASKRWSNITDPLKLEETLAEDFRKFMQSEEEWYDNLESKNYSTIRKTLSTLFHKLKNFINELSGKTPYINRLYYSINRGKFARRRVGKSDVTRFSKESYTSEMQSLKDKAIANGTFMKAPNGNPTNLTERQWLQVRTKNFIKWFGDWINDPANASKVVDENGEPKVMFHGSRKNDLRKFKAHGNSPNRTNYNAFYFADNPVFAENVAKARHGSATVYPVFLNIRNPLYGDQRYVSMLKDNQDGITEGFNIKDGRINRETFLWNPNQIKSATDNVGTFNPSDPDIYYRRIEQYHRDKWLFENLSQENRDYLQERGITPTEYSQMTQLEKEVLFHCKY